MKQIQEIAAFVFIVCVVVLTGVSILGIWGFLDEDVIFKSIQTVGLLATVSLVAIVAGRYFVHHEQATTVESNLLNNQTPASNVSVNVPLFAAIRKGTLVILIIAVVLLAFFGVLAIWDLLEDEILGKTFSSIALLAFASAVIVVTCMTMEGKSITIGKSGNTDSRSPGIWSLLLGLFFFWLLFRFLMGWL